MHILALGLNHRTAPVEIRERLAFPEPSLPAALDQLVRRYGLHEAAILSTCNRSEIYVASDSPAGLDHARHFLNDNQGVDALALKPHFYELTDAAAADHLFHVACGIDSLILGESQILSEVRQALETAQANGSAHLLLNRLFQTSLRVGKRARTETSIGRGQLSIATAAVELASQIFDQLEGRQALLLGAGEMGELTAQYLVESGIDKLWVANRTLERAQALAQRFDGGAVPFASYADGLGQVDIVISSTGANDFVLGPDAIRRAMRHRRGRPLFLIDIAVPRDIDPAVRDIDNVFLFDIDDLQQVVEANRQEREAEITNVKALINEELGDFLHWFNTLEASPLISQLRQHSDDLRQVELARWQAKLAHLGDEDRQAVEGLLRGYANKLLHTPQVQIRQFANADDGYLRLDTVRRLFGLENDKDQKS